MHPIILYELAESRIEELMRDAERQRRIREAANARPSDTTGPNMSTRIQDLVLGRPTVGAGSL
jgi:hypothetical protein